MLEINEYYRLTTAFAKAGAVLVIFLFALSAKHYTNTNKQWCQSIVTSLFYTCTISVGVAITLSGFVAVTGLLNATTTRIARPLILSGLLFMVLGLVTKIIQKKYVDDNNQYTITIDALIYKRLRDGLYVIGAKQNTLVLISIGYTASILALSSFLIIKSAYVLVFPVCLLFVAGTILYTFKGSHNFIDRTYGLDSGAATLPFIITIVFIFKILMDSIFITTIADTGLFIWFVNLIIECNPTDIVPGNNQPNKQWGVGLLLFGPTIIISLFYFIFEPEINVLIIAAGTFALSNIALLLATYTTFEEADGEYIKINGTLYKKTSPFVEHKKIVVLGRRLIDLKRGRVVGHYTDIDEKSEYALEKI